MRDIEIQSIVDYLQTHSITDAARFFHRDRKTIYRITIKYDVHPPRHHAEGLSIKQLEDKWHQQDQCNHEIYVVRCSKCKKIIGSDKRKADIHTFW